MVGMVVLPRKNICRLKVVDVGATRPDLTSMPSPAHLCPGYSSTSYFNANTSPIGLSSPVPDAPLA